MIEHRSRRHSRRERAGASNEAETAGKARLDTHFAGWEYLISSGEIDNLPVETLREFFKIHEIQAPNGKLAMLDAIRNHHDQEVRKQDWGNIRAQKPAIFVKEEEEEEGEDNNVFSG